MDHEAAVLEGIMGLLNVTGTVKVILSNYYDKNSVRANHKAGIYNNITII